VPQWDIPHDEAHRFLDWGPQDAVFESWITWLTVKGIPFEIGGGADKWTIYKHQLFVEKVDRRGGRCCIQYER
jgi:hypothetical protein